MGVKVDFTPSGKPITHGGSGTAYANYGCRCDECKAANSERTKRRRLERYQETAPPGAHGKYSTYSNWGCRCEPCSLAGAEHNKDSYEKRKKEAHGET